MQYWIGVRGILRISSTLMSLLYTSRLILHSTKIRWNKPRDILWQGKSIRKRKNRKAPPYDIASPSPIDSLVHTCDPITTAVRRPCHGRACSQSGLHSPATSVSWLDGRV